MTRKKWEMNPDERSFRSVNRPLGQIRVAFPSGPSGPLDRLAASCPGSRAPFPASAMTHVFAPFNPHAFRVQLRSDGRLRKDASSKSSSSKPRTASNPRSRRSPIVAFKNPFANDAEKAKKGAESVGDGVKKAAEDTAKGAKGWWDKEVVGAKNAMDRRAGQTPGKDVYTDLRCTLEESVLGGEVKVSYPRRVICPTCDGKGRLPQTFIDCDKCENNCGLVTKECVATVTVPPGVNSGSTLRLRGEGDQGAPSDGDLYVKVAAENVNKGGIIRRQGADLYTDVVVRYPRRGEDTSVRVRTVEGDWGNLKVASDAKIGSALRIAGRGAPTAPGGSTRGDHFFVITKIAFDEDVVKARDQTTNEGSDE